jgi:hypothetical protein
MDILQFTNIFLPSANITHLKAEGFFVKLKHFEVGFSFKRNDCLLLKKLLQ